MASHFYLRLAFFFVSFSLVWRIFDSAILGHSLCAVLLLPMCVLTFSFYRPPKMRQNRADICIPFTRSAKTTTKRPNFSNSGRLEENAEYSGIWPAYLYLRVLRVGLVRRDILESAISGPSLGRCCILPSQKQLISPPRKSKPPTD